MLRFLLLSSAFFCLSSLSAQNSVRLQIHHHLGSDTFALEQTTSNNMGSTFRFSRFQYYLSNFRIFHDGGQIERIAGVYALVNAQEETIIDLGSFSSLTTIDSIEFSVGVNQPENNEDPSLWPANHPLAPQSPSMHWGWIAGYRFAALEGLAGPAMATTFQFHPLGNDNYFPTILPVVATQKQDTFLIHVNADYTRALENINVDQGPIVHGDYGLAVVVLENFNRYVFRDAGLTTSTSPISDESSVFVFPNPSSGSIHVTWPDNKTSWDQLEVLNPMGQRVYALPVRGRNDAVIQFNDSGYYMLRLSGKRDAVITRLVIQ